MCEPLRGSKQNNDDWHSDSVTHCKEGFFYVSKVKSAVKGLIKHHEDIIEEKIKAIDNTAMAYDYYKWIDAYMLSIKKEYENIQVIEHWLEDAIEIENKCEMCGCPESFHFKETVYIKYGDNREHLVCKNCGVCS